MSKYYRHKGNEHLKVKFIGYKEETIVDFQAIAITVEGSLWKVGQFMDDLDIRDFEPYTPTPQELIDWGETDTLTNDNPNNVEVDDKDVNLRLECLKLTIITMDIKCPTGAIDEAEYFYDWITKKH